MPDLACKTEWQPSPVNVLLLLLGLLLTAASS